MTGYLQSLIIFLNNIIELFKNSCTFANKLITKICSHLTKSITRRMY